MRAEAANLPGAGSGVPLIAHVIYRLDVGGLENGVVNLVNRMPCDRFRHAIVCLTGHTEFRRRLQRDDVALFALDKPEGNSPRTLYRLGRLLRALRPDIVHTRNLAALEALLPAALAGVPVRVHGEHGRDADDADGTRRKYRLWRRLYRPLVHRYVAVSKDLQGYLCDRIGVPAVDVTQIYNGVDTERFHPAERGRAPLPFGELAPANAFVIGWVGRMQAVKDPLTLAHAFVQLRRMTRGEERAVRLVMVGDGPLRRQVAEVLEAAGAHRDAWLAGERADVAALMRGLDVFVLPSLSEGISNTILEAMASGLPVVATAVGGNPELVRAGVTGTLVPRANPLALAQALSRYCANPAAARSEGAAARRVAEREFSLGAMVGHYLTLYESLLQRSEQAKGMPSCAES